jgi:hypothetical protein
MHEDWQDSEGTDGKYWGMGSEARKMVADRVKAKGGALRNRKTCLNLRWTTAGDMHMVCM